MTFTILTRTAGALLKDSRQVPIKATGRTCNYVSVSVIVAASAVQRDEIEQHDPSSYNGQ
jgi:hypothetical protein